MKINSKETIAGQPILKIRKLFQCAKVKGWGPGFAERILKVNQEEEAIIIKDLEELGYIKKSTKEDYWELTDSGSRLSLATAANQMKRNTALRILNEFMDRVEIVCADDYFLCKVTKVLLFGSYLGNAERISDIDIALEIEPKEQDYNKREMLYEERINKALNNGRHFPDILSQRRWPRDEVLLYLKSNYRISIHYIEDWLLESGNYEVLYGDPEEIF